MLPHKRSCVKIQNMKLCRTGQLTNKTGLPYLYMSCKDTRQCAAKKQIRSGSASFIRFRIPSAISFFETHLSIACFSIYLWAISSAIFNDSMSCRFARFTMRISAVFSSILKRYRFLFHAPQALSYGALTYRT